MDLPNIINLGQVWQPIRRDSSKCIATLRSAIAKDTPRGYLTPGVYNGGFLKVTECTDSIPDLTISNAIRYEHGRRPNDTLACISPLEFRALYIIHRHYETTTG